MLWCTGLCGFRVGVALSICGGATLECPLHRICCGPKKLRSNLPCPRLLVRGLLAFQPPHSSLWVRLPGCEGKTNQQPSNQSESRPAAKSRDGDVQVQRRGKPDEQRKRGADVHVHAPGGVDVEVEKK